MFIFTIIYKKISIFNRETIPPKSSGQPGPRPPIASNWQQRRLPRRPARTPRHVRPTPPPTRY